MEQTERHQAKTATGILTAHRALQLADYPGYRWFDHVADVDLVHTPPQAGRPHIPIVFMDGSLATFNGTTWGDAAHLNPGREHGDLTATLNRAADRIGSTLDVLLPLLLDDDPIVRHSTANLVVAVGHGPRLTSWQDKIAVKRISNTQVLALMDDHAIPHRGAEHGSTSSLPWN